MDQILNTAATDMQAVAIDKYTPVSFIEGLIFGAMGAQVQNLATCVKDSGFELKEAQFVLEDIYHFEGKQAAEEFVKMLKVVPTLKHTCPLAFTDIDLYENGVMTWINKQLADPKAFAEHVGEDILTNKNDIVGKSKDAVAQYKKGDWWMVGYDMGSLVSESVVGKTYPVPPHQIHMI